ncbi:MAG TPA: SulP family inorganic anion transporter, partial [Candidatus Melainabacteria bacterium]|nr:SulP family inorganic anion transporter [Candidatus Melainabacteria bacterium]
VPDNLIEHGFVFPDFQDLVKALPMLPHVALFIFMLTFVDGTESLATVQAVDRIDPFHRKSDPDRTLFAMGIANICSSMIGGLTIIPGIIKSTTCIVSGGRTAWVNFYNALFLIVFLLFAGGIIRMIPIAALAAVLMHIGYKLAGAHKWRSMIKLGGADLAIFSLTIFVTLISDLMLGIAAGMLLEAFVLIFYAKKAGMRIGALASSPIQRTEIEGEVMDVYVGDAFHCFNSLKARSILDAIPENVKKVVLHCQPSLGLIDHSTRLYLATLRDDMQRAGKVFEIEGLEQFKSCGTDSTAFLYRLVPAPQPQIS